MIKNIRKTPCGINIIEHEKYEDERGDFTKIFHCDEWRELKLVKPQEAFVSISKKDVIRGLHFQDKKIKQTKYVTCLKGKILDVVVDIRKDSMYFNQPFSMELSGEHPITIVVPWTHAHGFLCQEEDSIVHYYSSTVYNKEMDLGYHWQSIDFEWPTKKPIVSSRDNMLPSIGR